MNNILVSVVMTVFNGEKYIEQSVRSILKQSFPYFELIILNDGSKDGTGEVLRKIVDPRIRYQYFPENMKIPFRRNQAINMAQSEFIAIQDADDISLPNRLEDEFNFLKNNIAYFGVGGHAEKIDTAGNSLGIMDYPPPLHERISQLLAAGFLNPIIDPTTMFRKKEFINIGMYSLEKDIYTVPDLDLWGRVVLSGSKLANLQMPLIKYRVNPQGMTSLHKSEMIRAHATVQKRFASKYFIGLAQQREEYAKKKT